MTKHTHHPVPPASDAERGGEFGWHVHEALQAWTASVDSKASIVLVVEGAVGGAAFHLLVGDDDGLGRMGGAHLAFALLALALLGLALASALAVVFPRLARRQATATTTASGLIYFGHLRDRPQSAIEQGLAQLDADAERRELASQLQITAQIAWRKHAWLQLSLLLVVLGSLVLLGCLLIIPATSADPNRDQFGPHPAPHSVLVARCRQDSGLPPTGLGRKSRIPLRSATCGTTQDPTPGFADRSLPNSEKS
jgi:hypothetical protein